MPTGVLNWRTFDTLGEGERFIALKICFTGQYPLLIKRSDGIFMFDTGLEY